MAAIQASDLSDYANRNIQMAIINIKLQISVFIITMLAAAVSFQSPGNAVDIKDVRKNLNPQKTQRSNIDISSMIATCEQDSSCNNSRFIFLRPN